MTPDPVALLVAVVVLDAVVIAGIVLARLAGLRSARRAATSLSGPSDDVLIRDRFIELGDSRAIAARLAGAPPSVPPPARDPVAPTAAAIEALPEAAVTATPIPEAEGAPEAGPIAAVAATPIAEAAPGASPIFEAAAAATPMTEAAPEASPIVEDAVADRSPASDADIDRSASATDNDPSPSVADTDPSPGVAETDGERTDARRIDGDFGVGAEATTRAPAAPPRPAVAVGPENGSPETDEWRRALRRERARVARYGRVATIMQLELDLESEPSASSADVAQAEHVLQGLVSSNARASDFVARTARGRFHLLLPETPETRAASLAERIRTRYRQSAPGGPQLLIGWAGAEPQNGLATSSWAAADRVHEDRRRVREVDEEIAAAAPSQRTVAPAPRPPAESSIEESLATLERLRGFGLVSEEEYRAKRSDILARL